MEAMLQPVDEPLIRALRLDAAYRIADVGCGTGGATLEILRQAPKSSVVHGFDLSPALIEVALTRMPSGDDAIAFKLANMVTAAAPELLYQRLVSRFGIMFFNDAPAAFRNLAAWLAPGGRFAFAAWGPLAENLWMTTVHQVAADFIELPKTDPEAPGPFRYADPAKLLALLESSGFSELAIGDWRGTLPVGGALPAAQAASFALSAFSSFGEQLAEAGDNALNDARQSLTERFLLHENNGAVRLEASVHIFTGTRVS